MSNVKLSVSELLSKSKHNKIMNQHAKLLELKYLTGVIFDFGTKSFTSQALWASNQLGIKKSELQDRNFDYFKLPDKDGELPSDEIVKLRQENYEKRRRNKMRVIVAFLKLNPYNSQAEGEQDIEKQELYRVRQQMKQLQQQEDLRLNRLKQVNRNIEENARIEVSEIDKIKKRSQKLEKAAVKKRGEQMYFRKKDQNEHNRRQSQAQKTVQGFIDAKTRQSLMDYQQLQRDVEQRLHDKLERDRLKSCKVYGILNNLEFETEIQTPEEPVAVVAATNKDLDDYESKKIQPVEKPKRPKTAPIRHRAPSISIKAQLATQEMEKIEEVMQAYQTKMESSDLRLEQSRQERMQVRRSSDNKRERMMELRKQSMYEQEFEMLKTLQVTRDRKTKQVREQRKSARETREYNAHVRNERLEQVKTHQNELRNAHKRYKSELEVELQQKATAREYVLDQTMVSVMRHKELRLNKHLEVQENRDIDRRLVIMDKMRLLAKQEQIHKNYNELRQRQAILLDLRHKNAQSLQELQHERAISVKNIKDNYLNEQEKIEKESKAKLERLERKMKQEVDQYQ